MENDPLLDDKTKDESDEKKFEKKLMQTIKQGNFEEIENMVTPRAFQKCESNSLIVAMKANFKIRNLADNMGPDKERFSQLANTVEEFTATLLDPLRSDKSRRKLFGDHILDDVLEVAIANEQKKFFAHPVVHEEMDRKWSGRKFQQRKWKCWQRLLLNIWCLFDLVFSPILLPIFSQMKAKEKSKVNIIRKNDSARIVMRRKSQKLKVRVGDQAKFECKKQNSAYQKSRTWSKDGAKLDKEGSTLVIKSAQQPDKGRYTCVVENNFGRHDRFTATLTVDPLYIMYLDYLETPYYKFLRDTLSYIILLFLHFVLCLAPSTKPISGLEWTIFVFFVGRYLVERKQFLQQKTGYFRDCWNRLDFISLIVYLGIFLLRVGTTIMPGPVANNRTLAIAGYLYGFNTLCLTLRTFGHAMEQSKFIGTIQIALLSILGEIQIVLWQFMAALLAFSITLTKIYMTEKSFVAKETDGKNIACSKSGFSCWWAMFTHLGWSLLGLGEFDPLESTDHISETIGRICFAAFLIMAVILLVNMLIALLSNTYQRTEDNSFKEWSFQRAITIQTYDAYDPIPVPLNIIYNFISMLLWCVKGEDMKTGKGQNGTNVHMFFKHLEEQYFENHTNLFPVTDAKKLDLVLKETERNRQMVSQILNTTFTLRRDNYGRKAWKVHRCVRIEGLLLTCTCEGTEFESEQLCFPGARFLTAFSSESPHFEVVILETGKKGQFGIGVVNENYNEKDPGEDMPGWHENSIGYHTSDGQFFYGDSRGIETRGHTMARRGDLIRCTMVEGKREHKVSFFFTLNGRVISTKKPLEGKNSNLFTLEKGDGLYPYIAMADGCSVLARMYAM